MPSTCQSETPLLTSIQFSAWGVGMFDDGIDSFEDLERYVTQGLPRGSSEFEIRILPVV